MRSSRLPLVLVLMGAMLLGVYWVGAQEGRPLYGPPPVLPTDALPAPTVTKGVEKKGMPQKSKADPTLIIPAEAYDVPRPLSSEPTGPRSGVLGVVPVEPPPPPTFPPTAPEQQDTKGPALLPLPALDAKPLLLPTLQPELTKVLIVEPTVKDAAPKKAEPQPQPPPTMPTMVPPPNLILQPKEIPIAPPVLVEQPKMDPTALIPPPAVIPEPTQPSFAPPTAPQQLSERAFIRIQSKSSDPPVLVPDAKQPLVLPPPIGIGPNNLVNLQTPSVTVEKRGVRLLRTNEAQSYQIVIRNLGPVPAQQVRLEDELPTNVKIVAADPMPTIEGNKSIWILSSVNVNQEQTIRLTLQASADTELTGRTSVHVSAATQSITTLRPRNEAPPLAIQLTGPAQVVAGKPAVFEIRVANQTGQALTGIILHGFLGEGLTSPAGREIVGNVDGTIPPGDFKILKMPATAVKPGHNTVSVKVVTSVGESSATMTLDIVAETILLQQAPTTRLLMGRDGDLRIELVNNTGKPLRNVTVADRLPDGLDFVKANERGLYQANSRTVHWLIDQMPVGQTQTLLVRVNGTKAGQHQNVVFAKADGLPQMQTSSVVALEGLADLTLRVLDRDDLLEQGKQIVYEIVVQNPGNAPAHNVQLQVQLSPGLTPRNAEGSTRYTLDRRTILFEPIPVLAAGGQLTFRVTAVGQALGDQRMRCAIVSDQVRVPIQREVSTRVVER